MMRKGEVRVKKGTKARFFSGKDLPVQRARGRQKEKEGFHRVREGAKDSCLPEAEEGEEKGIRLP